MSVSILSKYNENSKERTFQLIKENSVLDINPVLSNGLSINDFLYNPENNNLGTFAIFVIDHSTETGKLNNKSYKYIYIFFYKIWLSKKYRIF